MHDRLLQLEVKGQGYMHALGRHVVSQVARCCGVIGAFELIAVDPKNSLT